MIWNKMMTLKLFVLWFLTFFVYTSWAQLPNKVSFKCDLGTYLCMCNGCQKTINNIDYTATLHCSEDAQFKDFSQFEAIRLPNGNYAFRAFNGKYMTVCDGCIEGGSQTSFITFHESSSDHLWAQFEVKKLNNGRYSIRNMHAQLFIARCNGCSPGASTPDQVTAHAGDAGPEWAQWEIIDKEENNNNRSINNTSNNNVNNTPSGIVNGENLRYVEYNNQGSIGKFIQTRSGGWKEYAKDGTFSFDETQRDEWSVYLIDRSRNVSVQLDLWKKEIYLNWDRENRSLLYAISEFSSNSSNIDNSQQTNDPPSNYNSNQSTSQNNNSQNNNAQENNSQNNQSRNISIGHEAKEIAKDAVMSTLSSETKYAIGAFFSKQDEVKILKWISDEVTDSKVQYCWKRSHPRRTEPLTTCANGLVKEDWEAVCYTPCKSGYKRTLDRCWQDCPSGYTNTGLFCSKGGDSKHAPSRLADCPSGYTNTGLTCFKEASTYSAPSTLANCPKDFEHTGTTCHRWWPPKSISLDNATCPSDRFKRNGRCYVNCREGYTNNGEFCGRGAHSLSMNSMICPQGYFQGADARCHQNCENGYTNTGEHCIAKIVTIERANYYNGAGEPMKCREGLIHNKAGLCFEPCPPGYIADSDADPVCWQPCRGYQSTPCGAGCADNISSCAQETFNMVDAVVQVALNIISLGETSAVTAAKKSFKVAVMSGDRVAAKAAAKLAAKELAKGFEQLTTKKVVKQLKDNMKDNAIEYIQEQYATLLLKTANNDISTDDLWELTALDPTGIADVVKAFYKPLCTKETPFPNITQLK